MAQLCVSGKVHDGIPSMSKHVLLPVLKGLNSNPCVRTVSRRHYGREGGNTTAQQLRAAGRAHPYALRAHLEVERLHSQEEAADCEDVGACRAECTPVNPERTGAKPAGF